MRRDEIAKLILKHIVTYPESKDTFEGILQWWISRENISVRSAEVKGAIDWLIVSDILIEKKIGDSEVFYCVNQEKLRSIREVFNSPNL